MIVLASITMTLLCPAVADAEPYSRALQSADVVLIGYTSFEETTTPAGIIRNYEDKLDQLTDHELTLNPDQPPVRYNRCANGQAELGYRTFYVANSLSISRNTAYRKIGVVGDTSTDNNGGGGGVAPDGSQYYMLEDTDGFIYVQMDPVRVVDYTNVAMHAWVHVDAPAYSHTRWNDNSRLRVWAQDITSPTASEVVLLDAVGDSESREIGPGVTEDEWVEYIETIDSLSDASMSFGMVSEETSLEAWFDYFRIVGNGPDRSALLCDSFDTIACEEGTSMEYKAGSDTPECITACGATVWPPGSAQPGGSMCIACQAGTFKNYSLPTAPAPCTPCPTNTSSIAGGLAGPSACSFVAPLMDPAAYEWPGVSKALLERSDMTVAVTSADFNNDGLPDVYVVNQAELDELLLNDGMGGFISSMVDSSSSRSQDVATADFNGDGAIDALVAASSENNKLMLNDGAGTFTVAPYDQHMGNSYAIESADFDNDGLPDAFVGNYGQQSELLLNDGAGSFISTVLGSNSATWSLATADFNNDNWTDVFLGNLNERNELLLNNGAGGFGSFVLDGFENRFIGHDNTYGVATADFNNDGLPDLLLLYYQHANALLLQNQGAETPAQSFTVSNLGGGQYSRGATVADFNQDGLIDALIVNSNEANQLLLNDGAGGFSPIRMDRSDTTIAATSADFNVDGVPDALMGNTGANEVLMFRGTGGFVSSLLEHTAGSQAAVIADFNLDGLLDALVSNMGPNEFLLNDRAGGFTSFVPERQSYLDNEDMVVADFNNDGLIDVLAVTGGTYSDRVSHLFVNSLNSPASRPYDWLRTNWRGTAEWSGSKIVGQAGENSKAATAADFNNDGWMDVLLVNAGMSPNELLWNDGAEDFNSTFLPVTEEARNPCDVASADFNLDGWMDALVVHGHQTLPSGNELLLNDGTGSFNVTVLARSDYSRGVTIADFNNDGWPDAFVANEGDRALSQIVIIGHDSVKSFGSLF